jgi:DNA-binding transcriptional regulator/RsmH inhibitor MraZ
VGRVWTIQVDGQERFTFKKPVRLSLPIDRSLVQEGADVVLSRWDKNRWRKVRTSRVEGDRVIADVDHFSEYAPTPK